MQWLNNIVDEVIKRRPTGEILIESGSAPSGAYHLGHLREVLTPDAVYSELKRRGRQVRHIHFVDDLDPLRKIPVNVPAEFEQYLGMPLCDIPAPDGSDRSYADFFLDDLKTVCQTLGIEVEFLRSYEKYRSGFDVPAIELVMSRMDKVRESITSVSGRELAEDWVPIQFLENGRFKNRLYVGIDTAAKTITYKDADGAEHTARYDNGEVKLDWRLDWPAHWWLQDVAVEPFGRDHASAGGSWDTGEAAMKLVYEHPAPIPVPYDFINMAGDNKKMSASKGTGLNAVEAAQIMPAEVMRYFVFRAPASKRLYFDPHLGLMQLMDDFSALIAKSDKSESEKQLVELCVLGDKSNIVSRVPFSHLVASYQASLKDVERTLEVVRRTEYHDVVDAEADVIRAELRFIDAWLKLRAPDELKFELREQVDAAEFNDTEKALFAGLADKVAAAPADAEGEYFHLALYEMKDQLGLKPQEVFSALYRLLIGRTSGPRAGWFLSILPRDWLITRLRLEDAVTKSEDQTSDATVLQASLTDSINFALDAAVSKNFPEARIGFLVAEVPANPTSGAADPISQALESLASRGITADNLTQQPEIAAWRAAYGTFGVKPSKYLCSAEALAKRTLKGNPAQVSPIVDAYNAVSLKHLIPMGAVDLAKVKGDITIRYGHEGEQATLLGFAEPVDVTPQQVVYADNEQVITWLWNHRDAVATAVNQDTKLALFIADSLQGAEHATEAVNELAAELTQLGAKVLNHGVIG